MQKRCAAGDFELIHGSTTPCSPCLVFLRCLGDILSVASCTIYCLPCKLPPPVVILGDTLSPDVLPTYRKLSLAVSAEMYRVCFFVSNNVRVYYCSSCIILDALWMEFAPFPQYFALNDCDLSRFCSKWRQSQTAIISIHSS